MLDALQLPLLGLAAHMIVMAALWARQRVTRNAGLVDLVWGASIGLLALTYCLLEDGWWARRLLVALLAGAWSLRLTLHLGARTFSEAEDGRYAAMRTQYGERINTWLFWFFQAQALLAVLLSLVFLVLARADQVGWRVWDLAAVSVWTLSFVGEHVADRQLARWRANPENRGRTCRAGLWKYSRHPNYFFEWIHWLAYPALGVGLPYGWLLWLAPAVMLYLVLEVTGIPPTEEQSLRSRGDDYRAYQRSTNAFFPGPPRAQASEQSLDPR